MSQRWTVIAELATGVRMVPKDEADAYAAEVERLREAGNELDHLLLTIPAMTTVEFRAEMGEARAKWAALNGKESQ